MTHRLPRVTCLGRWALGAALAVALPSSAAATTYHFAVDVPTTLGGTNYTPGQVVQSTDGTYSLELTLPAGCAVSALHQQPNGSWWFVPAHPVTLTNGTYEPRDVVGFDGTSDWLVFDGEAALVPPGARIDALLVDSLSRMLLSFDEPVTLSGTTFHPADLVAYDGSFALFWDAEAAGVPPSTNIVGAALDPAGDLVLTFDVPTTLGSVTYLPGTLVGWNGGTSFSSFVRDAAWPPSAQLRDFSFLPPAGAVPDGKSVPGQELTASRAAGGQITLNWGFSCLATDTDFAVYQGTLGSFYSHQAKLCSTAGAKTATFVPPSGNLYFLVVPHNQVSDGSYGVNSSGTQRPPGSPPCLPQIVGACP